MPVLDWPSRSPDLNPIGQTQDELGRRVCEWINTSGGKIFNVSFMNNGDVFLGQSSLTFWDPWGDVVWLQETLEGDIILIEDLSPTDEPSTFCELNFRQLSDIIDVINVEDKRLHVYLLSAKIQVFYGKHKTKLIAKKC